jgi:hypothetical protein
VAVIGTLQCAWAQEVTASITGTVTDPSGAAVAGANVTATSQERGITFTAVTNDSGLYRVAQLPVGLKPTTSKRITTLQRAMSTSPAKAERAAPSTRASTEAGTSSRASVSRGLPVRWVVRRSFVAPSQSRRIWKVPAQICV